MIATATQTEQIGLRVDASLKALLEEEAERRGVSPTSCVREILAWSLGYEHSVSASPSPRRQPRKVPSIEVQQAVEALHAIKDIGFKLEALNRSLTSIPAQDGAIEDLSRSLHNLYEDLAAIRSGILRSEK